MVSAPVSRGGGGEKGKGKGGRGRGKGEGERGKGERGKGKRGRGKEEGEGGGGKREGGRGRGETGYNGQERKREDIPVSVIPVTVETQHSHVIAKEVCPASHRVAVAAAILCVCVIYTKRLPLNTHVKKIYFNQTTHTHPRLKHRLFIPNFPTIYYGKPCCPEGFLRPPCASFPDLSEILKRGSDKWGGVKCTL